MSTEERSSTKHSQREFYRLAAAAIRAGLLTAGERDTICRPGTRKAGYWARHLHDLRAVVKERWVRRLERRQADQLVRSEAGGREKE